MGNNPLDPDRKSRALKTLGGGLLATGNNAEETVDFQ